MSLGCRTVIGSGQKPVEIHGPFPEVAERLIEPHRAFWR
jgi:hypothetical protein